MKQKPEILPEDLADLAKLSTLKEWETACRLMNNRIHRDKNAIMGFPEDDPVKLAVQKSFYRGRIAGLQLLQSQVSQAPSLLDKVE